MSILFRFPFVAQVVSWRTRSKWLRGWIILHRLTPLPCTDAVHTCPYHSSVPSACHWSGITVPGDLRQMWRSNNGMASDLSLVLLREDFLCWTSVCLRVKLMRITSGFVLFWIVFVCYYVDRYNEVSLFKSSPYSTLSFDLPILGFNVLSHSDWEFFLQNVLFALC